MIRKIEYSNAGARGEMPTRYAEIDWMDDCLWRVFVRADLRVDTVWRKSLTSAQSTARQFIQSGRFPR